jgi:hypothetical protein
MENVYVRMELHNRLLQSRNAVLHNTKRVSSLSTFSIQCTVDFQGKWWGGLVLILEKQGKSKTYTLLRHERKIKPLFIYYIDNTCITAHERSGLRTLFEQSTLKSRHYPPSSLVISNLRSSTDNPQTGQSARG